MRFCLPVNKVSAISSLRILAEKAHKVFGVGPYLCFVSVVTVDKDEHAPRADGDFRAFVVARRRAHSALGVTINGQSGDVEHPPPYALVRLALTPYAERQRVADELVGVETADAVTVCDARKVD